MSPASDSKLFTCIQLYSRCCCCIFTAALQTSHIRFVKDLCCCESIDYLWIQSIWNIFYFLSVCMCRYVCCISWLCWKGLRETETVAKVRGSRTSTGMCLQLALRVWLLWSTKRYKVTAHEYEVPQYCCYKLLYGFYLCSAVVVWYMLCPCICPCFKSWECCQNMWTDRADLS